MSTQPLIAVGKPCFAIVERHPDGGIMLSHTTLFATFDEAREAVAALSRERPNKQYQCVCVTAGAWVLQTDPVSFYQ